MSIQPFKSIRNNASSLLIAQIIYKPCTLIVMLLLARSLGVELFGLFSYCLSIGWFFLLASDFGLSELFIRDVAKNREKLSEYISNIIPLKIIISLACVTLIVFFTKLFALEKIKSLLIIILSTSLIIDSFMYFLRSLFRVGETMIVEAKLMVAEAFLKLLLITSAIKVFSLSANSIIYIAGSFLLISLINFTITAVVFLRNYGKLKLNFDASYYLQLLKKSFPLAFIFILTFMNFRIDMVMLSNLLNNFFVGWYASVFKVVEQFFIIPIVISTAVLPVFSRLSKSTSEVRALIKKVAWLLLLIGVGAFSALTLFSKLIISLIYGSSFFEAQRYLPLLSLVLVPFFMKLSLEKLIYSINKTLPLCLFYSLAIILNVVLNYLWIPIYGVAGACFATIISEILMTLTCFIIYKRFTGANIKPVENLILEDPIETELTSR